MKRRTTIWVYPVAGNLSNPHEHIQEEIHALEDIGLTVVSVLCVGCRNEVWVICEGDEEDTNESI